MPEIEKGLAVPRRPGSRKPRHEILNFCVRHRSSPCGACRETHSGIAKTCLAIYGPDISLRDLHCEGNALMSKQPAFALEPAAIFDERAVGADQAVTGHN